MEPEKKSNGAFVGLAVIIVILIVGGIYIWMSNKSAPAQTGVSPSASTPSAVTNQDSAELNALEQSINTTDTNTGVDVNTVN